VRRLELPGIGHDQLTGQAHAVRTGINRDRSSGGRRGPSRRVPRSGCTSGCTRRGDSWGLRGTGGD
jgi:hypothetical protein